MPNTFAVAAAAAAAAVVVVVDTVTAAVTVIVAATVTIDYISVGNPGNAADSTGYGAVTYAYQIGKYEVTNAQYPAFLNAVDPDGANTNGT